MPTRDRSAWLAKTLEAALAQTLRDLEVIVVNNDTAGSTASESVTARAKDSRVRHLRTGGLGMAQNWQAGVEAASGEFVLVCSDKLLLLPWLLETAEKLFHNQSTDAVVWQIGDNSLYSDAAPLPLRTHRIEGRDIMHSAASGSWRLFLSAGARGMTSVIRRSAVTKAEKELGVPICRQVCPDFTMALSLAVTGANNTYIEHVGAVFLPGAHGNGYLCLTAQDEKTIKSSFEVPDLESLPTSYMAAVNGIYHDIVSTINSMKPEERMAVNWEMYFVNLIHEAVDADDLGGFSPARSRELLSAIRTQPLKFRLSLFKTILVHETTNLVQGRRPFFYQLSRMGRLLSYPCRGFIGKAQHP